MRSPGTFAPGLFLWQTETAADFLAGRSNFMAIGLACPKAIWVIAQADLVRQNMANELFGIKNKMSQNKSNEGAGAIHARQIRAARALLGWSQADLEKKSKVSRATIKRMEAEDGPIAKATAANVARIVEVCETKGVRFLATETGGLGVIWEKPAKKEDPVKDKGQKKRASSDSEKEAPAAAS